MRPFSPRPVPTLVLAACALAACSNDSSGPTGTSTATAIGLTGGNVQVAAISTALPLPLLVHVTDQYGAGFAGAVVTFTGTGGATFGAGTVTTDASGNATNTMTLGSSSGVDTVTASVSGVTLPAMFFETALAGPPVSDSLASGNAQTGTTGVMLSVPLSVIVYDSHHNVVVGDTVTWASATGTLSGTTVVTNSTGMSSVQFTPALGTNSVTATISGSTLVVTFTEIGN